MNEEPTYPIGTKFTKRGKQKTPCKVVDIWKTYDAKGRLVKTRYVAEYKLLGHKFRDHDVMETAIYLGDPTFPKVERPEPPKGV